MKHWNKTMSSICAPEQPIMSAIKLLTWKKQKCWEIYKKRNEETKKENSETYFSKEIIIFTLTWCLWTYHTDLIKCKGYFQDFFLFLFWFTKRSKFKKIVIVNKIKY